MRLLFVIDGRSPTALSWLRYWMDQSTEVHLVSTYPCNRPDGLSSFRVIPVAFGNLARRNTLASQGKMKSFIRRFLYPLRYLLGPASMLPHQREFLQHVRTVQPDLVHAMRIPYEGILASVTPPEIPFIVSIWGNDITLHAHHSSWMGSLTRKVLKRADGLLADTSRDIFLSKEWGLSEDAPTLVVPGSGGVRLEKIDLASSEPVISGYSIPNAPIVINPRGQRPGSLRQDIFLRAIPWVLKRNPDAIFLCPALKGDLQAENLVKELGIDASTFLWPKITQAQLWGIMKKAQVFVSPSLHDGTPNSLLEAMACGCFPVVGNIESFQEWIENGVNGILVDANNEIELANAIVQALNDPVLQAQAFKRNHALLKERADYSRNMARVKKFYEQLIAN